MIVQKFGGTSIGSAQRIEEVAELVSANDRKAIVVLSAMSRTTNSLVEIARACKSKKQEDAFLIYNELFLKYSDVLHKLFHKSEVFNEASKAMDDLFHKLRSGIENFHGKETEYIILSVGEYLSTTLFHLYLKQAGVASQLLNATDFMKTDIHGEPDLDHILKFLRPVFKKGNENSLHITQGFICENNNGEVDNLGRGGSDYTATLIGSAIGAEEIQIWTDVDGLQNNDPRYVDRTSPVREISFDEAAELAYFGAKILHPQCVLPAKRSGIPVLLKNTLDPSDTGTRISAYSCGRGFKAVAAKDGITAIKIKSGRMLMAYGFIRKVFEVFEKYHTPVDMITTSEVAVSATIDCRDMLVDIVNELKQYGEVLVDDDQTIITLVGDVLGEDKGLAHILFESIKDIPVRMISYGASNNNISILVNESDKVHTLQTIQRGVLRS